MKSSREIPFLVKICGITHEEDAQVAVDAGANALGFNFYSRSKRYLTPAAARDIVRIVGGDYLRVGVFVNPKADEVMEAIGLVPLDVVQIHGDTCPELPDGIPVWRSIDPALETPPLNRGLEAFLLDTPSAEFGGSGLSFPWELAANFPGRAIIAGGLDAANVAEAVATARPWGVDACSRLEHAPGRKDAERVRNFVRAAFAGARALSVLEISI
jgi:phosphoribosylanthranilate isomerase